MTDSPYKTDVNATAVEAALGDCLLAAVVLMLLSPVWVLLAFAVRATLGKPILYRGERLGVRKRPFTIIKFRTLPVHAQQTLGAQLFGPPHHDLPFVADFLRESRLDECPQLINILRGEMRFIGPRPERPEIYEHLCKGIRGYEERFEVAPGLFGISQLCTPHNTPKKLRARLDRRYVKYGLPHGNAGFAFYALGTLLLRLVSVVRAYLWKSFYMPVLYDIHEKRIRDRVPQQAAFITLYSDTNDPLGINATIVDMNFDHLHIQLDQPLDESDTYHCTLQKCARRRGRYRFKTAGCRAHEARELVKQRSGPCHYLVSYVPDSALSQYVIEQYFLYKSLIFRRI